MDKWHIVLVMAFVMLSSCSVYKTVPAEDFLFTGGKVMADTGKLNKDIRTDLEKFIKPPPNSKLLGIPFKLLFYNSVKEPTKSKGYAYNVRNKWGQAPALLSEVKTKSIEKRMEDELFNKGYLRPEVHNKVIKKGRKARVEFGVSPGDRYTIREIHYPADSSVFGKLLQATAKESLLHTGDYFDLKQFSAERERMSKELKEKGYYYFEPDYLLYRVDSLHQAKADLYVTLKDMIPAEAKKVWHIGGITIYGNYTLERDSLIMQDSGRQEKQFTIIDRRNNYRTSLYERAIPIRQGQLYATSMHSLTIERLMNLNTYRFVKMAFTPVPDSITPILNTRIFLSPAKKQTMRFEISGNTKSNNYVGSEISVTYKNVNLNRGAEIFDFKITGGFDVQVGGQQASENAYSLTAEMNLYVPQLIPGLRINTMNNPYLPRTVITPAIEYFQKTDLYTMRSIRFSYGYIWKRGKSIEQNLKLLHINGVDPINTTPKFDSMMATDASLKAAFEKQIIIGTRYLFQYNNTYRAKSRFNYAFDGGINTSGNIAGLFVQPKGDTAGSKQVFNVPLSQFIRFQADLRGYWRFAPKLTWANRIIGGVGFAYGNSSNMPYSEQFFIGGSSSLRAFRARTLGPGSYHTEESVYNANESGDIKMEFNSELRYNMSRFVKLAVFVDAGNIWYRKEVPDKPGASLERGELFKETAVGTGLGLRFDASVLVVRFDLAMPLRKPWYPEGERWVINQVNFGDSDWRKENLVLNIGIGYPF
ncbi:BamA/TamA family outer membrane protein [Flavihumibacter fluvii]|uniref:translocation and assembly module lipoprotein TamL n=1 Tax=Flavihumibacter fluvii TaxID=2838157 RepID=UPI001BDF5E21|nr:BamA/TamA family outer membrane protein [Flavihumibacter fluvii]ULQ53341.1 BamA/TamA family outer membrane protein [Flavihumibacter fluvii]